MLWKMERLLAELVNECSKLQETYNASQQEKRKALEIADEKEEKIEELKNRKQELAKKINALKADNNNLKGKVNCKKKELITSQKEEALTAKHMSHIQSELRSKPMS
jgi:phage I-like protein